MAYTALWVMKTLGTKTETNNVLRTGGDANGLDMKTHPDTRLYMLILTPALNV